MITRVNISMDWCAGDSSCTGVFPYMVTIRKWLLPDQFWFTFCIIGAIKRIVEKKNR